MSIPVPTPIAVSNWEPTDELLLEAVLAVVVVVVDAVLVLVVALVVVMVERTSVGSLT
ncbi:hypothetical protein [Novosphingobium humi]|uniref:Uncharacterized protein n=1 Tax=Novosphingobium humi TaxID=2282397 RepID=A0ABY7TXS4_9SPHN|nr:hypothetical protein [Novosphingobium humi]WCT76919.1 hypothetical protein PQ457_13445 [Novosphingobium humi]WJS99563.1 hypothetical protein NYQ05_05295 [Novosphingobium humi]